MIDLKIVSPKGVYANKQVKSITVNSVEGQMTILPNHIPIFAALVPCELTLRYEDAENETYAISGGFFQFDQNKSLLLTDAIEGRGEIDLERAQKAYQRAKERLEKRDSDTNMRRAELALKRAIARMNVHG
ncbi:MAG: ATP synthase F1 subunit epsilon [Firmicutes bacterium]|nr:ATP synthase F1 subunit epsilon [Bacillota bacterium]